MINLPVDIPELDASDPERAQGAVAALAEMALAFCADNPQAFPAYVASSTASSACPPSVADWLALATAPEVGLLDAIRAGIARAQLGWMRRNL